MEFFKKWIFINTENVQIKQAQEYVESMSIVLKMRYLCIKYTVRKNQHFNSGYHRVVEF